MGQPEEGDAEFPCHAPSIPALPPRALCDPTHNRLVGEPEEDAQGLPCCAGDPSPDWLSRTPGRHGEEIARVIREEWGQVNEVIAELRSK